MFKPRRYLNRKELRQFYVLFFPTRLHVPTAKKFRPACISAQSYYSLCVSKDTKRLKADSEDSAQTARTATGKISISRYPGMQ